MKLRKKVQAELDTLVGAAVREWGYDAQFLMLAEECIELSHVALKVVRNGITYGNRKDAIEEMADVLLMLNQLYYMLELDGDVLNTQVLKKINRTKNRIKNG